MLAQSLLFVELGRSVWPFLSYSLRGVMNLLGTSQCPSCDLRSLSCGALFSLISISAIALCSALFFLKGADYIRSPFRLLSFGRCAGALFLFLP